MCRKKKTSLSRVGVLPITGKTYRRRGSALRRRSCTARSWTAPSEPCRRPLPLPPSTCLASWGPSLWRPWRRGRRRQRHPRPTKTSKKIKAPTAATTKMYSSGLFSYLEAFCFWGNLAPLQSSWSLSCDHGLHCNDELVWEQQQQ